MNKDLTKKIEVASLEVTHEMCIESLPPDLFEQWEAVRSALIETRKVFKDEG